MLRRKYTACLVEQFKTRWSFYVCTAGQINRAIKPRGTRRIGHVNLTTAVEPSLIYCTS